ncbi:MAG: hypothetical protein C4527_16895 [Candidatus Omnitrophota bacterium]|jgi:hypothetical protein|nr:MAG: hypothetical protein C4527_16895 [Candidatus Omnitrophota bacterium]
MKNKSEIYHLIWSSYGYLRGKLLNDSFDEIRHQIIRLIGRPKARVTKWSPKSPIDWQPEQVINPDSGMPFTRNGAWQFVKQKLEENHPLEEIELQKPPKKKAYVMRINMGEEYPELYVKLQLGSGEIIGRSFHYSKK